MMRSRLQKSTRTFQKINGEIQLQDFGKSSCVVEISAEGDEIILKTAEVTLWIPKEKLYTIIATELDC